MQRLLRSPERAEELATGLAECQERLTALARRLPPELRRRDAELAAELEAVAAQRVALGAEAGRLAAEVEELRSLAEAQVWRQATELLGADEKLDDWWGLPFDTCLCMPWRPISTARAPLPEVAKEPKKEPRRDQSGSNCHELGASPRPRLQDLARDRRLEVDLG